MNYFYYNKELNYLEESPYHSDREYPEYPFKMDGILEKNVIYNTIRQMFFNMGLDKENYNTPNWNPLGKYISPGNVVLLKPNLVKHINPAEADYQRGMDCMITHPSIVRVLFDYTYIALKGQGKIIIADAPVQGCNFNELVNKTGYDLLFKYIKEKEGEQLTIDIEDLRETQFYNENNEIKQEERKNLKYRGKVIDLGQDSFFSEIENKAKLRITDYDAKETVKHHSKGLNEYCVSSAVIEADVIINIPKPKTHRIAGYTAALKNMIGINSRKEFLPHHQFGTIKSGGDEYPDSNIFLNFLNSKGNDIRNWALKRGYKVITNKANSFARYTGKKLDNLEKDRKRHGFWYGNDTLWRTILDINKIVFYCGKDGKIKNQNQRTVIHFGDMVVSGEKEGPLHPSYKKVGGLLFSEDAIEFDICAVKLMGFSYSKFPVLKNAILNAGIRIEDVYLNSNNKKYSGKIEELTDDFGFEPTSGWREIL